MQISNAYNILKQIYFRLIWWGGEAGDPATRSFPGHCVLVQCPRCQAVGGRQMKSAEMRPLRSLDPWMASALSVVK